MRKHYIILILLLFTMLQNTAAQKKPRFFIMCIASGDSAEKYAGSYERVMAYYLEKEFPCAKVTTQGDIIARVGSERVNQLLGHNDGSLRSFCDDLSCDYFLNLELTNFLSNQIIASASCIYYKKVQPMVRFAKEGSRTPGGIKDLCNLVSETLADKLSRYEICPFTGPVTLNITTDRDTTTINEYRVYCNESDQMYRTERIFRSHTESIWNLERKGIPLTEGTMTFSSNELTNVVEEDGCHKCKSGREGGRIYTQKSSYKVKGSGISHQSSLDGKPQEDTRIELKFFPDGTYTINPKGTSLPAKAEEHFEVYAEGTCDNLPRELKILEKQVTLPMNPVFGPYLGKSSDKILKQKDEKIIYDPVTGEKITIIIEFELKHD